jgi:hypothetical protein
MAPINASNVVSALRMDTEICMNYGEFYGLCFTMCRDIYWVLMFL